MFARWWNSVRVKPGHRAVTLTPLPDSSLASPSENEVTQALAAEYDPMGAKPATEETLMIRPPAALAHRPRGGVAEDEHRPAENVEHPQLVADLAAQEGRLQPEAGIVDEDVDRRRRRRAERRPRRPRPGPPGPRPAPPPEPRSPR